jgi:hypothetical protein
LDHIKSSGLTNGFRLSRLPAAFHGQLLLLSHVTHGCHARRSIRAAWKLASCDVPASQYVLGIIPELAVSMRGTSTSGSSRVDTAEARKLRPLIVDRPFLLDHWW